MHAHAVLMVQINSLLRKSVSVCPAAHTKTDPCPRVWPVIKHLLQHTPALHDASPIDGQFVQLQVSGGKLRALRTRIVTWNDLRRPLPGTSQTIQLLFESP